MWLHRRLASFFGERCIATLQANSEPFRPGEELVEGTNAYRITRVLRGRELPGTSEWTWEIWGRPIRARQRKRMHVA